MSDTITTTTTDDIAPEAVIMPGEPPSPAAYRYILPGEYLAEGLKLLKDAPAALACLEISREGVSNQVLAASDGLVAILAEVETPGEEGELPSINGTPLAVSDLDTPVRIPVGNAAKLPIRARKGLVGVSGVEMADEQTDLFDNHQIRLGVTCGGPANAEVRIAAAADTPWHDIRDAVEPRIEAAQEVGELPLSYLLRVMAALKGMHGKMASPMARIYRGEHCLVIETQGIDGPIRALVTMRSVQEGLQEQAEAVSVAETIADDLDGTGMPPPSATDLKNPWRYRLIALPAEVCEEPDMPVPDAIFESTMPQD